MKKILRRIVSRTCGRDNGGYGDDVLNSEGDEGLSGYSGLSISGGSIVNLSTGAANEAVFDMQMAA